MICHVIGIVNTLWQVKVVYIECAVCHVTQSVVVKI